MPGKETTKDPVRVRVASRSTLPTIDKIDDPDLARRAMHLLQEATECVVLKSEAEDRLEQVKAELAMICEAYSLKGLRYAKNSFEYTGWQTRRSLSKERLLELGVSADVIDQAMVEGTPFLMMRVVPFDLE